MASHHPVRVIHPGRVTTHRPAWRQRGNVADLTYEIRVRGRVSTALLDSFDGMASAVEPVETVLHGPVRDQAELHSLIDRIQTLGLELVEVRRLPG
jgi:hypothetical protein